MINALKVYKAILFNLFFSSLFKIGLNPSTFFA